MTAFCGGATSSARPGVPGQIAVGAATLSEWAASLGLGGIIISALIDGFIVDTANSCTRDPPALPVWDAEDAISFVLGTASPTWSHTQPKINDLLYHYAWLLYCQCDDGTQPPPFVPPAPPPGVGSSSGSAPTPCWQGAWVGTPPILRGEDPGTAGLDIGTLVLPISDPTPVQRPIHGTTYPAYEVRHPLSQVEWTAQLPNSTDPFQIVSPVVDFVGWDGDNNVLAEWNISGRSGEHYDWRNYQIDPGVRYIAAVAYFDNITTVEDIPDRTTGFNIRFYCGAGDSTTLDNCCPPDPSIILALNNIIHMLTDIENQLGNKFTGYVDGPRHSALSGTGSILPQATTIAVRWEMAAPYPPVVIVPGTPSYYYNVGFVTPYVNFSALRSSRLSFVNQTVQLPAGTDQIGYTLYGGVSGDLVELAAAPTL